MKRTIFIRSLKLFLICLAAGVVGALLILPPVSGDEVPKLNDRQADAAIFDHETRIKKVEADVADLEEAMAELGQDSSLEDEFTHFYSQERLTLPSPEEQIDHFGIIPQGYDISQKPNILIIMTDDQPRRLTDFEQELFHQAHSQIFPDHFSREHRVETRYINSLYETGIFFRNAYATIDQCGPSRASFWTSQFPSKHKVETNGPALPENSLTMPHIFAQAGYVTSFFGKCHLQGGESITRILDGSADEDDLSNYWLWNFSSWLLGDWAMMEGSLANPYTAERNLSGQYLPLAKRENAYFPDYITTRAIEFINHAYSNGQKFFTWIAYRIPHPAIINSFDLPGGGENFIYYPDETLEQVPPIAALNPFAYPDNMLNKPEAQRRSLANFDYYQIVANANGTEHFTGGRIGTEALRNGIRRRYEFMTHLDSQIGRILFELDQLGLRDDTLIVFVSDNGALVGERGLHSKGEFFYEELVNVPLIMSWKGNPNWSKHVVSDAYVESIDLMPTLLDIVGLNHRWEAIVGDSFRTVLENPLEEKHRESIFFQYQNKRQYWQTPARGLRKGKWKFSKYFWTTIGNGNPLLGELNLDHPDILIPGGRDFELYNLEDDPGETINLLSSTVLQSDKPLKSLLHSTTSQGDREMLGSLIDLLRTFATWLTDIDDPYNLSIKDVVINRQNDYQAKISWDMIMDNDYYFNVASEILYQEVGCLQCPVYQIISDYSEENPYDPDVEFTINNLERDKSYDVVLFSHTQGGRGGIYRTQINESTGEYYAPLSLADNTSINTKDKYYLIHHDDVVSSFDNPEIGIMSTVKEDCIIVGGQGALLYEELNTSRKKCQLKCDEYVTHENRRCEWGISVLKEWPSVDCTISQSATETDVGMSFDIEWGSENASSCTVTKYPPSGVPVLDWGTGTSGTRPSTPQITGAFSWEIHCEGSGEGTCSESIDHTVIDTGRCEILQGSGAPLNINESSTRDECHDECFITYAENQNRSCTWKSELLRATPTDECLITNQSGTNILHFDQASTRFECQTECDARAQSNPNKICTWGSIRL